MSYSPLTCILSEGLNLTGCTKDNTGGVSQVIFANFKDAVTGSTTNPNGFAYSSTTGEITGVTTSGAAAADWYIFDTVKETSSLAEAVAVNVQNGTMSFTPTVTLVMNKMNTQKRNLIHMLALGTLIAVVKDNNDTYWMCGFRKGLDVTAVDNNTGTALGDRNGSTITLTGAEPLPMAALSAAAVTQLNTVAVYA
jgi:hypothetical protein